jgi:hypothetical protein
MRWLLLVALAACGDNLPPEGAFEIVGHSDLGARGMNSALAVYEHTVYVGSRIDNQPVLIVDVSDPAAPAVVGELGAPDEGVPGMSSRELRVVPDLKLLVVLNLQCSPDLHGCMDMRAEGENLKLYDLTDPHAPVLVGTYRFSSLPRTPRSPHELFIAGHHALVSVPGAGPQLEIVDLETRTQLVAWDPGLGNTGDDILHSVSTNADATIAYLSHQTGGLALADLERRVRPERRARRARPARRERPATPAPRARATTPARAATTARRARLARPARAPATRRAPARAARMARTRCRSPARARSISAVVR